LLGKDLSTDRFDLLHGIQAESADEEGQIVHVGEPTSCHRFHRQQMPIGCPHDPQARMIEHRRRVGLVMSRQVEHALLVEPTSRQGQLPGHLERFGLDRAGRCETAIEVTGGRSVTERCRSRSGSVTPAPGRGAR